MLQRLWQCNARKIAASVKRIISDPRHAFRNDNLCHVSTLVKRLVTKTDNRAIVDFGRNLHSAFQIVPCGRLAITNQSITIPFSHIRPCGLRIDGKVDVHQIRGTQDCILVPRHSLKACIYWRIRMPPSELNVSRINRPYIYIRSNRHTPPPPINRTNSHGHRSQYDRLHRLQHRTHMQLRVIIFQ